MPGPGNNKKSKVKRSRASGNGSSNLTNVDIPTVLDACVDEINDADGWENIVDILCRLFELPGEFFDCSCRKLG